MNPAMLDAWSRLLSMTLLHFLWQGAALGALAALLAAALHRRKDARVWHASMLIILLAMFLAPFGTVFWLSAQPQANSESVALIGEIQNARLTDDLEAAAMRIVNLETGEVQGLEMIDAPPSMALLGEPVDSTPAPLRYESFVSAAYLAGVLLMLLRLVVGIRGGQSLRRQSETVESPALLDALRSKAAVLGLKAAPALACCARVAVPTVVGVLRPMILLPVHLQTGFTIAQLELLLLHELAHIRRHDHLINLVQRVAETLLFFHPAVWYVNRQIAIAREHCCDELVLRHGGAPQDYARLLLESGEYATGKPPLAALTAVDKPSRLRRRIARILDTELPVKLGRAGVVAVVSLLVIGLTAILVIAAQRKESTYEKPAKTEALADAVDDASQTDPRDEPRRGLQVVTVGESEVVTMTTGQLKDSIIEELVRAEDPWLRTIAAQQAGRTKDRVYVPYLIDSLLSKSEDEEQVRTAAATALGEIGDPKAIPYLFTSLRRGRVSPRQPSEFHSTETPVRVAAADAIAQMKDQIAVFGILRIALEDDLIARSCAYFVLGRIGTPDAVGALISGLNYEGLSARWVAVGTLAKLASNPEPLAMLKSGLTNPDPKIAEGSLLALAYSESQEAYETFASSIEAGSVPLSGDGLQFIVEKYGDDVRVISALGRQLLAGKYSQTGAGSSQRIAAGMLKLGLQPNEPADLVKLHVLAESYDVAARFGEVAVPPLIEALGEYPERSSSIIRALGQLKDPRAVPALESIMIGEGSWEPLNLAMEALRAIGTPEAANAIARGLSHSNTNVRRDAAQHLGSMKAREAVPELIRSTRDAALEVRYHAVAALGAIGDRAATPALIAAAGDQVAEVRLHAIRSLGTLRDASAMDALVTALNDSDDTIQLYAAEALGELGDPRAIEPLVAAYDMEDIRFDQDGSSRWGGRLNDAIRNALDKLGADGFGLAKERFERESKRDSNNPNENPPDLESKGTVENANVPASIPQGSVVSGSIGLLIDGDDRLYVDGLFVAISELEAELQRRAAEYPGLPILVLKHERADRDTVGQVTDILGRIERDKLWILVGHGVPTTAESGRSVTGRKPGQAAPQRDLGATMIDPGETSAIHFSVLDRVGDVVFEGTIQELDTANVRAKLEALRLVQPDLPLTIQPSAPIDWNKVETRIGEIARSLGFRQVSWVQPQESQQSEAASTRETPETQTERWEKFANYEPQIAGAMDAVRRFNNAVAGSEGYELEDTLAVPVTLEIEAEALPKYRLYFESFEEAGGEPRRLDLFYVCDREVLAISNSPGPDVPMLAYVVVQRGDRWVISAMDFLADRDALDTEIAKLTERTKQQPVEVSMDFLSMM